MTPLDTIRQMINTAEPHARKRLVAHLLRDLSADEIIELVGWLSDQTLQDLIDSLMEDKDERRTPATT